MDISDDESSPESPTRRTFQEKAIKRKTYEEGAESERRTEARSVFGWTEPTEPEAEPPSHSPSKRQQVNIPAHQRKLPVLPVPALEHTMSMYLKSLEPLLPPDEFDDAEAEVEMMMCSRGDDPPPARQLQERLLKSTEEGGGPSWLERWWDDGYLCARDSIAINVNYFFGFEDDKAHTDPVGRAAGLLHGALEFYQKLKTETLSMDMERDKPLCMSQMARVFGASRVPDVGRDRIETYTQEMPWWLEALSVEKEQLRSVKFAEDCLRLEEVPESCPLRKRQTIRAVNSKPVLTEEEFRAAVAAAGDSVPLETEMCTSETSQIVHCAPRHVIVMHRSRFFSFDVFADSSYTTLLSTREIEDRIAECVLLCQEPIPDGASIVSPAGGTIPPLPTHGPPAGAFTTMDRDEWARVRQRLVEWDPRGDGANLKTLERIQQALFVVALDEFEPTHDEELARIILHGDGTNRWFDRHTLIVCRNGRAGINFEHSVGDGATTLRVADEMFKHSKQNCSPDAEVRGRRMAGARHGRDSVSELHFSWSPDLLAELRRGMKAFEKSILATETDVLQFRSFGGDWIKRMAKMSPDAFVQVGMQLAYYKLFGRNDATYEAASTRAFLHGRTEVVRSATLEAKEFCEAATSTALCYRRTREGDGDMRRAPRQFVLLKRAVEAHVAYMRQAKGAQGVDRHLLGLCMTYKDNPEDFPFELPSMFRDDTSSGYRRSTHWNLSTSHCGSPSLRLFGFGPVVYDGFGVGYMIKNDVISFTITSKYTGSSRSAAIFATLLEESLLHLKAVVLASPEHVAAPPRSKTFSHPGVDTDMVLQKKATFRRAGFPRASSSASGSVSTPIFRQGTAGA
eukprot:TRINITY_DN6468_c0_g2_i2.p1 TRINITY_DN6468_c0_g2~~TRINITY_DN6468_c0_g2_i2.p1  ORF type:complete len:881 (+),score=303.46 TRINITY_DN6468_c0_g2_i2:88-2643(+)